MWYVLTYQPLDPKHPAYEDIRKFIDEKLRGMEVHQLLQYQWIFRTNGRSFTRLHLDIDGFFGRTNDRYSLLQIELVDRQKIGRGHVDRFK